MTTLEQRKCLGIEVKYSYKLITNKCYNPLCQDLNLAKTLVRPTSLFLDELSNSNPLSNEGYGSVKRAFIICASDKGIPKEFQLWLIKNFETPIVKEIKDADHMAMISSPHKLCQYLLEIANVFQELFSFTCVKEYFL